MTPEQEQLLRQYAGRETTWFALREQGFENYRQVLAGLGELGLRPPVAPLEGPNAEKRRKGRAILRAALKGALP
jgi:hypothetical protein